MQLRNSLGVNLSKTAARRMYNITVVCTFITGFEGLYAVSKNVILTELGLHRIKGVDPNSRQIGMSAFSAPRAVTGHGSSVE